MSRFIKFITFYAVILLMLAFLWPFVPVLPIGHLPFDVTASAGSLTLYLAFGTAFLLTGIITFILYIFQRF